MTRLTRQKKRKKIVKKEHEGSKVINKTDKDDDIVLIDIIIAMMRTLKSAMCKSSERKIFTGCLDYENSYLPCVCKYFVLLRTLSLKMKMNFNSEYIGSSFLMLLNCVFIFAWVP